MLYHRDRDAGIFLQRITKLSPEDFIALAKVLDVKMSTVNTETGEYALRDADDVLNDMIAVFRKLKHNSITIIRQTKFQPHHKEKG